MHELIDRKRRVRVKSSTITMSFLLKNVGDLTLISGILDLGLTNYYFVMLNNDLYNPVFAVGSSKQLHK